MIAKDKRLDRKSGVNEEMCIPCHQSRPCQAVLEAWGRLRAYAWCTWMYVDMCTSMCRWAYVGKCLCVCLCRLVYVESTRCMHAYTEMCICTYESTYTHIHTYTHTNTHNTLHHSYIITIMCIHIHTKNNQCMNLPGAPSRKTASKTSSLGAKPPA